MFRLRSAPGEHRLFARYFINTVLLNLHSHLMRELIHIQVIAEEVEAQGLRN